MRSDLLTAVQKVAILEAQFAQVAATKRTDMQMLEALLEAHQDLFVLNVRYQDAAGPDVDMLWHVRGVSESLEADTLTYLGQGDLDSTSGAGNDIRFDFASLGILPDGGVVVAYHDSTHEDPLFAVELDLPA